LIGDTIKFTNLDPYRIKITGRTKHYLNVFGEELMVENADNAIEKTCRLTGAQITDYTVAPLFMNGRSKGGHEWLIEFRKEPDDLFAFTRILDDSLKEVNSDYEAKRYLDMTLEMPRVHSAREGLFYDWMKVKNKLGGQHKVPRLSNERDYLEELMSL
jgi:hypothetical protein